ncbi:hypothetical protein AHAS_Ahas18G0151400 [Arachis hypogaea]
MLSGRHNLTIAAIVRSTYMRMQNLFVRKDQEAFAQLSRGNMFSQYRTKNV